MITLHFSRSRNDFSVECFAVFFQCQDIKASFLCLRINCSDVSQNAESSEKAKLKCIRIRRMLGTPAERGSYPQKTHQKKLHFHEVPESVKYQNSTFHNCVLSDLVFEWKRG